MSPIAPISAFVAPLIIIGIVYILSLFDLYLAQQRINNQINQKKLIKDNME